MLITPYKNQKNNIILIKMDIKKEAVRLLSGFVWIVIWINVRLSTT